MSAKKLRSNKQQIQILVDFMSTHSHLATGEFTSPLGAKRSESQWQIVKNLLKDHGPDRTVDQWKQTWRDLKKSARTENAAAARGRNATGNVQPVPTVSNVSTKVLDIIGHECSTGIGPAESIIGQTNEILEVSLGEHENSDILLTQNFILPPPTSYTDELENIPPAPSTSNPTPSTSQPAHTRKERPHEVFNRLQHENNAFLQGIEERLKERNNLLREQNEILREQNAHLSHRNKLKRMKRFARRF